MKKIMMFLLLASVTATAMADVNAKLRFFETMGNGKRLNCYGDCRYLEMEIKNNFLSVRSCSIDEYEFLRGIDEAKAIVSENIHSKCKTLLKSFEITDEIGLAFKQKLSEGNISRRDPMRLLKSGSLAATSAFATFLMGMVTVGTALDPEIPLFLLTGPATVVAGAMTYVNGKEFISELKGRPVVIYSPGTAEAIRETIKKGQIGAFYIKTEKSRFSLTFSGNEFDAFKASWEKFAKQLERYKYLNSPESELKVY